VTDRVFGVRRVSAIFQLTVRPSLRCRRGASFVEFALVLPLLLALLFGIIECGFLFKDQMAVQQAAREGARAAAVARPVAEIGARVVAGATTLTPNALTHDVMSRYYNTGAWTAWVTVGDKTDGSGQNDAPAGGQVRVRGYYTHTLLTGPLFANLIGRPGASTMPMYAAGVMRRE